MACVRSPIIMILLPILAAGSRILMIPCSHKSHTNMFATAGHALQEAGHSVDVLVEESRMSLVEKAGVTAITFTAVPAAQSLMSDTFMEDLTKQPDVAKIFAMMTTVTSTMVEGVLQNADVISKLENRHYDIALVDGIDFARSLYIFPYSLGIRYITLTARHDPWNAGLPQLPSVEHLPGIGVAITENSTIVDRIQGLVKAVMVYMNMPPSVLDDSLITKYAPMLPKVTFADLFRNSEMWLCNLDTVCLDWPRVHGNHYQFVTGLSLRQAEPLPAELEEFVQGSKVGVIVLTFGSGLKNIPNTMLEKMLEAFSQIEQRVIMRHGGEVPYKVPANVKMLSWIPQGDLLGHPKTRAFITHGGGNGQLEAMYHSVPMITIPMFGDQPYNADRIWRRGFGVTLDKDTFTSEQLIEAINTVVKDKKIAQNIRKCSERFRSFPSAHDTILFWVEHVIRFGSDHLKPVALRVPLWKRFMLDIIGLFILVLLVIYTLLLLVCHHVYRKCSKPGFELPTKKSQ